MGRLRIMNGYVTAIFLKNLAHLNGQQASEFNYLQGKLDAYEAERRYQAQIEDYQAAWRQPYDNRSDYYQERDYESVNQLTEEGLPRLSGGSRSK